MLGYWQLWQVMFLKTEANKLLPKYYDRRDIHLVLTNEFLYKTTLQQLSERYNFSVVEVKST